MIIVYLNNNKIMLNGNASLTNLLLQQGYEGRHFAVAVNRQFIPRAHYATTILIENDAIEIISPMQGG